MSIIFGFTLLGLPFALIALLLFWLLLKFLNIWLAAIICFVLLSVIMIFVSYKTMAWWIEQYPEKAQKVFIPFVCVSQAYKDYKAGNITKDEINDIIDAFDDNKKND